MPGSHRFSYRELLRRWKNKDPRCEKDGGSFPDVLRAWEWPQDEVWVECKCTRCSGGDSKRLWCEIYEFKTSSKSNDAIMIHKFPCGDETWAVILGQSEGLDWLLWGHMDKHKPGAMFWNNKILLETPLSYVTPVSGPDKRSAQQRIGMTDAQPEGFGGSDNTEDEDSTARKDDSDDQNERESSVHSVTRDRNKAIRSDPPKQVNVHPSNHRIPQRSRKSMSDEFKPDSTSDENMHVRKRTRRLRRMSADSSSVSSPQHQTTGRKLTGSGGRHRMSNARSREATAAQPSQIQNMPLSAHNDIQSEDSVRNDSMHMLLSADLDTREQSINVTSTSTYVADLNPGPTASTQFSAVIAHTQQARPQQTNNTFDFSARQDDAYSRVLERGTIVPGTKVANALESLDAAANAHKESLFRRLYDMLNRELVKEGAEQLPAL